jgi:outer membrane protein, heavy metal efflux system
MTPEPSPGPGCPERNARERLAPRRRSRHAALAAAGSAALALAGCAAAIAPQSEWPKVESLVRARGETPRLVESSTGEAERTGASAILPEHPIDIAEAVQLALTRNPSLQAQYAELGIAQADLVQAGLLRNPTFGFTGLAAAGAAASPMFDLDLAQNLLDLLLRPSRQRIAGAQLEEATLRTAGEIVALAAETRAAFYTLQGALQIAEVIRQSAHAAEASAELAARLQEAGNVSALQAANERALSEQAAADLIRTEGEAIEPRERLARLMALTDEESAGWTVPPSVAELPGSDPPLAEALARAHEQRLELAAARKQQAALADALETARAWRYLGSVEAGAMAHKEQTDKYWVVGPSVSLELPIFDQKQAEIARLESRLRQSEARSAALSLDVSSQVRSAHQRLRNARRLAEQLRGKLIPLREQAVALSQQFYNFMLVGSFELLATRQAEIAAYRDYVGAVRDYWIARAELERAVGARLPETGEAAVAGTDAGDGTSRPSDAEKMRTPLETAPVPDHAAMHHHGGSL